MTQSNSATVLSEGLDDLVQLAEERSALNDDIKEFSAELRSKKLPAAALIKVAQERDEDKDKRDKRETELAEARRILGEAQVTVGTVEKSGLDEDLQTLAKNRVAAIVSTKAEIDGIKDQEKEIYASLKDAGFMSAVIKKIVEFRLDPEKRTKFDELTSLVETYESAIG